MDIRKIALEKAQSNYDEKLRIISYGYDDTYEAVTMATPELERFGDGFEYPSYIRNNKTGDEYLATGMIGVEEVSGFENFNWGSLTYEKFD